jgi:hypothetical protein
MLEGGYLLGQDDRVVCRQDKDGRAEHDPRGHGCRVARGNERLGPADAVEARRGKQVIRDEERREPEVFAAGRESTDLVTEPGLIPREEV